MRKMVTYLWLVCLILGTTGCNENTKSGQVVAYGGAPIFFELACEDGNSYGYVVNENTELIWKDQSAFSIWGNDPDEWNVFGCRLYVTVEGTEETESADEYVDECVEGWYIADKITVTGVDEDYFAVDDKPVIYLYPESAVEVQVKIEYKGKLTCTYPEYNKGWRVIAKPDGSLMDINGQEYNYLYWEGISSAEYDFSEGFCIQGQDTAAFLEESLAALGLSRREANEFIVYWLPLMESNPYNLISFQYETYTDNAQLKITPKPDTLLRVFMAWKPLEEAVEIEPQILKGTERKGFTVVEWGGSQVE